MNESNVESRRSNAAEVPPSAPDVRPSTPSRNGIIFVISGPSGAGKSTLLAQVRDAADFHYSISCTTRTPRPGEIDGQHYHFLSKEEFQQRLANDEFLEHAVVHGNFYGTLRANVMRHVECGEDVLIDVDIQGAAMIRAHAGGALRAHLVDIFLTPPSLEILRRRLMRRATESPQDLALRLKNASAEMQQWREYRYTILSDTPQSDLENFRAIMCAERSASARLMLNFRDE